jgi:predicted O-methyltransferase YrrM
METTSKMKNDQSPWLEPYSYEMGEMFKSLIRFNEAKVILEIGVAQATTTKYFCEAANETNGTVYGYDLWDTHGLQNQFQKLSTKEDCESYLNKFGFTNYELTKINSKTQEFRDIINSKHNKNIDFAFIDGCHAYEGIKNDFDVVYPNLSKFGVIAFHDTLRIDGCREFIIDLRTKYFDGTYDIVDFPYGYGSRRVGITLLVKRSFPVLDIPIDEICGSISTADVIYQKEKEWYSQELINAKK